MIEPTDEGEAFVLEGTLEALETAPTRQNLLDRLAQQRAEAGTLLSGIFNSEDAAATLMVATYDGEYSENFVAMIDGVAVCGQFDGAALLPVGAQVKGVARRKGELLIVSTLLAPRYGLCWAPYYQGTKAEAKENNMLAFYVWLFCVTVFFLIASSSGFNSDDFLIWAGTGVFGGALLMFLISRNSPMKGISGEATEDFILLGFDASERMDLLKYRHVNHGGDPRAYQGPGHYGDYKDVYHYQRAVLGGELSLSDTPIGRSELDQYLLEGPISELTLDPVNTTGYFDHPLATTDARHFSTQCRPDRQTFIAKIGGQSVCGDFDGSALLAEGDYVKAAVCQRGSIVAAQGILCEQKGLLLINYYNGPKGEDYLRRRFYYWCSVVLTTLLLAITSVCWLLGGHSDVIWAGLISSLLLSWGGYRRFYKKRPSHEGLWLAPVTGKALSLLGFTDTDRARLSFKDRAVIILDKKAGLDHLSRRGQQYVDAYYYQRAIKQRRLIKRQAV